MTREAEDLPESAQIGLYQLISRGTCPHSRAVQEGRRRCHDVRVYDNGAGDGMYSSEGLEFLG